MEESSLKGIENYLIYIYKKDMNSTFLYFAVCFLGFYTEICEWIEIENNESFFSPPPPFKE